MLLQLLRGSKGFGVDPAIVNSIASQVKDVRKMGVELAVVIGGGNFFRGVPAAEQGIDRATGDYIGMMATLMNSLILCDAFEKKGVPTRVQTAIRVDALCEPYIRRRAMRHLEKDRVVIFAAGTGNPYFTTDTAAALRATEINADIILKATKVDGIYDSDPHKNKKAKKFKKISYMDVLKNRLKVMDSTAISLCMDNQLPIVVFNMGKSGNIARVLKGDKIGTWVS